MKIIFFLLTIFSLSTSFAGVSDYTCVLKNLDSKKEITTATAGISRGSCTATNMNGNIINFCVTNNLGYRLGVSVFDATSRIYLMSVEQKLTGPLESPTSSNKNPQRIEFIKRDFDLHITCDRISELALNEKNN